MRGCLDAPVRADRGGGAGGTGALEMSKAVSAERVSSPLLLPRVNTSRSTRMMAATWGCQSVLASACAGANTLTVRRSSRLRPISWLWTVSSGVVVAATSALA